jgi:hypothetical protein
VQKSLWDGWQLAAEELPDAVRRRTITLELPNDTKAATLDGEKLSLRKRGDRVLVNLEVSKQPQTFQVVRAGRSN